MSPHGSDFVDDIVSNNLPTHIEPPRDKFLPWHRVKKEFIRRFQWNELAMRMAKRYWQRELNQIESEWSLDIEPPDVGEVVVPTNLSRKKPLRCLVIPGDDLLDVRALWRDTSSLNCCIRYLGFNERTGSNQEGTRVHVANNAVTSLPRMATDSLVLGDRFESIVRLDSQAYRYLKEYGPYHVVNLDFCGSIFPNTTRDAQAYHDALHQLLIYQFAEQKSEWLLFVTTEVEPAVAHAGKLQALCQPTRMNFDAHRDFAVRLAQLLPTDAFQDPKTSVDLSKFTEKQIVELFGIALGKWLLHLCHQAQPKWTIAMRRSYRYSINDDKGVVMLALAFELRPNIAPPMDKTGMSKLVVSAKKYPNESECAVKLAESVAAIRDVDEVLAADSNLRLKLRDAQASLLHAAGYDRAAF
jgi:hypothetical protein